MVPAGLDVGDAEGAVADADGDVSVEGDAGGVEGPCDSAGVGVATSREGGGLTVPAGEAGASVGSVVGDDEGTCVGMATT